MATALIILANSLAFFQLFFCKANDYAALTLVALLTTLYQIYFLKISCIRGQKVAVNYL